IVFLLMFSMGFEQVLTSAYIDILFCEMVLLLEESRSIPSGVGAVGEGILQENITLFVIILLLDCSMHMAES
ncbi:unnamed protein product, partial [marine sediment metagenome]